MVFEKKKINLETLSEYLVEVRRQLNLSAEEVSRKTGIKKKFLEALERGEYNKLPANVYALGFLKQLSELYAIDFPSLVQQYKKERNITEQIARQQAGGNFQAKPRLKKVVITPKIMSLMVGIAFVAATLGYIVWQVSSINKTPALEVFEPRDRQVIRQTSIEVSGRTDPGMALTINDQNVYVDSQGNFKAQIGIGNGPKDLVFTVRNKFDKSVSKTVSVVGEVEAPEVAGMATSTAPLLLRLSFTATTTVDYAVDSYSMERGVFYAGDSKTLAAQSKVIISTTNAGATSVDMNGQDLGPMGRTGEQLKNIPFSLESATINTSTSSP